MDATVPPDHPRAVRQAIRQGRINGPTQGLAPGYIQCNILILPREYADDFATYCELNRHACPLLARSGAGDPALPGLADDIDIRTDLGAYSVFEFGRLTQTAHDIGALWSDDFVTFAFGCSFSFEEALAREGVDLAYLERGDSAALYFTDIDTESAGPFKGKVAVSMRPLKPREAIKAILVTSRYPGVHGAPIHIGHPELIGIEDINEPVQIPGPDTCHGRRTAGILGLRCDQPACRGTGAAAVMYYPRLSTYADYRFTPGYLFQPDYREVTHDTTTRIRRTAPAVRRR